MNNTLPDDIEQLKALLIAQQAVIVRNNRLCPRDQLTQSAGR